MKHLYNEKYYKTGNYKNYLSKQKRYEKTAEELVHLLKQLKLDNKSIRILDYGCATGFLLDGFFKLGFKNTHGYDISEWALSKVGNHHNLISLHKKNYFDITTMLDVLEHMTDEQIYKAFDSIKTNMLIVRIPVSTDFGKSFHLEVSRADPTHINCKQKQDWIELLDNNNYQFIFELNLNSIYSTDGVFCAIFLNKGEQQ